MVLRASLAHKVPWFIGGGAPYESVNATWSLGLTGWGRGYRVRRGWEWGSPGTGMLTTHALALPSKTGIGTMASMDQQSQRPSYDRVFDHFDAPLMQRFRQLAYGEDIGQHSWTGVDELRGMSSSITADSNILDLGCGAGGPLSFIAEITGCRGLGLDISEVALSIGRGRAQRMGLADRVSFERADFNAQLAIPSDEFDAVLSVDVILHLHDRRSFLSQVSRVLKPGGRFMFTDAGVMTGVMTESERERRTLFGYTQFVSESLNEECLESVGLTVLERVNSTELLKASAIGRLRARRSLAGEFIEREGADTFEKQNIYLETIVDLADRRVLSRFTYTAVK